jgi:hypothetical protein
MALRASACNNFGNSTRSTQMSAALHGSHPWHAQGGVDLKSLPSAYLGILDLPHSHGRKSQLA